MMKFKKNMALGEYVLLEFLGKGASSEVWKAFDTREERTVTLKIGLDDSVRDSLSREAKIAKTLPKGLTPQVLGLHLDHDPPFLVRQWQSGKTLREVLEAENPLTFKKARSLGINFFRALKDLHQAGVVHGDLKPENILLRKNSSFQVQETHLFRALREVRQTEPEHGDLKPENILVQEDYQIQFIDVAGARAEMEEEDLLLSQDLADSDKKPQYATLLYMAPELRQKGAKADEQADIYSAGLIFFEIYTGRLPQGMELPSEAREEVGERIDTIFKKAVAPKNRRYADVGSLLQELGKKSALFASKPGLWAVLSGKYPSSIAFRAVLWLISFMGVISLVIFTDSSSSCEDRLVAQWNIGLFLLCWISLWVGRKHGDWTKKFLSLSGGLILFFVWCIGMGAVIEWAENLEKNQIHRLWSQYGATLKKGGNLQGLKQLCTQGPIGVIQKRHQAILRRFGAFLKAGSFQKGPSMTEKNKRKYFSTLFFSRGQANGTFIITNTAPLELGGRWRFISIQLTPILAPPLPPKAVALSWKDFRLMGNTKVTLTGRTRVLNEWRHKATGMDFVELPGGNFSMGSPKSPNAKPVHFVQLASFLMAKFPVTQGLWKKISNSEPWLGRKNTRIGDRYPAVYVTWEEARQFCAKLGFSLPTEAQWEYACRSGRFRDYSWGDTMDPRYGWYDENSRGDWAKEVGQKFPNLFDLYDMNGNVWEWCEDTWSFNYKMADSSGKSFGGKGNHRVVRGGSWNSPADSLRSWHRTWRFANQRYAEVGFRCVVQPVK